MRLAMLATLGLLSSACGTVDLGTYEGVRDIKPSEDYFYCVVQPRVLTATKCAGGDPSKGDATSGCHAATTSLRLSEPAKLVACSGGKPSEPPSSEERSNYTQASLRVTRDPESSPLLVKPTQKGGASHPRQIFTLESQEAEVIRKWIAGAR